MNLLPATCYLLPLPYSLPPTPYSLNLLAIDSATSVLSIAIFSGQIIYYKEADSNTKQSEFAMLIINDLMREAELKPRDLNSVICFKGPGSFTGLRIGYSIGKGLALSLNIPFIAAPYPDGIEIKKEEGNYFYCLNGKIEKRGFARELLEIGKKMDTNDTTALFSGPVY